MTPGGSSSPLREAVDLVAEVLLAERDDLLELARASVAIVLGALRPGARAQYLRGMLVERRLVEDRALLEEDLALVVDELARRRRADELALDLAVERVAEDLDLLVAHLLEAQRAPWSSMSLARSSFSVPLREKTRALMTMPPTPGRDAERAVADVAGLLAEDGAEELLFGGELRLALRRDLADQDVARLHLGADADDAATRRGP